MSPKIYKYVFYESECVGESEKRRGYQERGWGGGYNTRDLKVGMLRLEGCGEWGDKQGEGDGQPKLRIYENTRRKPVTWQMDFLKNLILKLKKKIEVKRWLGS